MNDPRRHHWWPMVQSRYWTNQKGFVFATKSDGTTKPLKPISVGVESELYTRFGNEDSKDTSVESWFGEAIDGPARTMIEHLIDPKNYQRNDFLWADPAKIKIAKELGFRVNSYQEKICLPSQIRQAIAQYLAALLVRHPVYLTKLVETHEGNSDSKVAAKNRALDNMLLLYKIYAERIAKSVFMVSRRVGDAEYLYADGGLMVQEPWREAFGVPFDIHAPLTPDLAIQVLPIPGATDLSSALVMEAANRGVARQNRIILGGAKRFVFSRQSPPTKFIVKNFAKPAPKNIGYQIVDGRVESFYDPARQ